MSLRSSWEMEDRCKDGAIEDVAIKRRKMESFGGMIRIQECFADNIAFDLTGKQMGKILFIKGVERRSPDHGEENDPFPFLPFPGQINLDRFWEKGS